MEQTPYRLSQLEFVLKHIANDRDCYISQAFFEKPCRRAVHLKWLTHGYVDLDIYTIPEAERMNPGEAGIMIRTFCRDEGIPEPSYIIHSGRGIYLKWMWNAPLPRAAAGRAVAVNRVLVAKFQAWGADPAAVDVSRILRVPGTINSKSGEVVRILYSAEQDGAHLTYDFNAFCDEILPFTLDQIKVFRGAARANAEVYVLSQAKARREALAGTEKTRVGNQKAFCIEDWHWGVLEDLRKLAELRFTDGVVPPGSRDLYGHIGACQLARVIPSTQLWDEIKAWSRILLPANYRERPEFQSHCSTLLRDAQRAARGEMDEWNGRKVTPVYTYRSSTLIERLKITSAEMHQMTRLIDKDEKRRRDREEWRASHTGLSREEYLLKNTISQQRPWEAEGLSRRQWYRDQRDKKQA